MVISCDKKGSAFVTCGKLQKFEERIGTINTPHFALGAVVGLNTLQKSTAPLGVITPQSSDITTSAPVAAEDDAFSSDLLIKFSANIPAAAQGGISNEIKQRTHIAATNVKRVSMNNVSASVKANPPLKGVIKASLQAPNTAVLIISGITYADSIKIEASGAVDSSATVKVLKYGDYELSVTYTCSDVLTMSGAQFGAFFKYALLRYDSASDEVVVDLTQAIDLADYNLNPALTLH
jgi:hypothetical protein